MTAKELIAYLETVPPEARVFENDHEELRELRLNDISQSASALGHPIDSAEYEEAEWEELLQLPIVIFGAWS